MKTNTLKIVMLSGLLITGYCKLYAATDTDGEATYQQALLAETGERDLDKVLPPVSDSPIFAGFDSPGWPMRASAGGH
jgi:hypothetical protein